MSGRKLTQNEIILAKKIFKESIKYIDVSIHHEKFAFFQPDNSGMTPNGDIYIDGSIKIMDYGHAIVSALDKAFFIHEMAHVWQKQNGVLNPIISAVANSIRHGFFYENSYKYFLEKNKDFLEYRMEQQAQIIEDYTRITMLNKLPNIKFLENKGRKIEVITLFEKVLSKFLLDPSYPKKGN